MDMGSTVALGAQEKCFLLALSSLLTVRNQRSAIFRLGSATEDKKFHRCSWQISGRNRGGEIKGKIRREVFLFLTKTIFFNKTSENRTQLRAR